MTSDDPDRRLREAFRFEAADLAENRAGRLSPHQAALLRAGRTGMRISLAVFAVVMLGSAGRAGLFNRRLGPPRGWRSGMDAAAALALAVIVIGYLQPPPPAGGALPPALRRERRGRDPARRR